MEPDHKANDTFHVEDLSLDDRSFDITNNFDVANGLPRHSEVRQTVETELEQEQSHTVATNSPPQGTRPTRPETNSENDRNRLASRKYVPILPPPLDSGFLQRGVSLEQIRNNPPSVTATVRAPALEEIPGRVSSNDVSAVSLMSRSAASLIAKATKEFQLPSNTPANSNDAKRQTAPPVTLYERTPSKIGRHAKAIDGSLLTMDSESDIVVRVRRTDIPEMNAKIVNILPVPDAPFYENMSPPTVRIGKFIGHPAYKKLNDRVISFITNKWPLKKPSAYDVAKAGLFYEGR